MTKDKKIFFIKCIILSGFVALIYFYNFFHQARYGGIECDTWYHLRFARELVETGSLPKTTQGYPLFYYLIATGFRLFKNYSISVFLFILVWSFTTNLIQIYFIKTFIKDFSDKYTLLMGSLLSFIWPISTKAISAFFTEDIPHYYWEGMLNVYLRSGTTAPYQNLTYLCSKPFALLTVLFFAKTFTENEDKKINKMIVLFSLMLLLSVLSKPNFYQCFAFAGVIMTIAYFFSTKCQELLRCFKVALAYIPATMWVLYTMTMKIQPIAFSPFEGINFFDDGTCIPIVLARAIIYVLFTLVFAMIYKVKDNLMLLALLTYLFGTLEWLLFIFPLEKGSLNMMWGYDVAMYLLFAVAVILAAKSYTVSRNKVMFWVGNILYGIHGLIGVLVFILTWTARWKQYLGIG